MSAEMTRRATAVLDVMADGKTRTASEIAVMTGLTSSTLSIVMRYLEGIGRVRKCGRDRTRNKSPFLWRRT